MRFARDQRAGENAFVKLRIGNFHQLRSLNDVLAEREVPGSLTNLEAHPALEPKPRSIHQRDEGDGCLANQRSKLREVIELRLRRRVEDAVTLERGEAVGFVPGFGFVHKSSALLLFFDQAYNKTKMGC